MAKIKTPPNQTQRKNLRERILAARSHHAGYDARPGKLPDEPLEVRVAREKIKALQKSVSRFDRRCVRIKARARDKVRARANELCTEILFSDDAYDINRKVAHFEKTGR
jgi:hypothetical protein